MCQTQNNTQYLRFTTEQSRIIFLIDSLYRLTAHGAQGSTEYIFDKITEKEI